LCRGSLVSKWAATILLMELIGALLVSVGAGLVYAPAGLIAFGVFLLVFAIAAERSSA
jgi:hypothetical protein